MIGMLAAWKTLRPDWTPVTPTMRPNGIAEMAIGSPSRTPARTDARSNFTPSSVRRKPGRIIVVVTAGVNATRICGAVRKVDHHGFHKTFAPRLRRCRAGTPAQCLPPGSRPPPPQHPRADVGQQLQRAGRPLGLGRLQAARNAGTGVHAAVQ